jgi:prepilin-type N-terminal cleavage/methylation domain-containing protein
VPKPSRSASGFTLIEMMIVVAVAGILVALAASSMIRARPRAQLAGTASEVQALVSSARLRALASGHNVALLVFPNFVGQGRSKGRLIVYEDGDFDFFSAAGVLNLDNYDPAVLAAASARSAVIATLDLPNDVEIGPAAGMGTAAALVAPYAGIPVNLDCTFCDTSGAATGRRGAVVFDAQGRARFFSAAGATPPGHGNGGSLSLTSPVLGAGARTLVITALSGSVRAFNNG